MIKKLNWKYRYLFIRIFSGDISRGFGGDGFKCVPVESCTSNPLICDANADCTLIGDYSLLDNAPNYLVGCIIQKTKKNSRWETWMSL